eukprot:362856-Chlamydomonas_euryale.AAC.7
MACRQTLGGWWMGHVCVLRMDEGRLPWKVFDCSLARCNSDSKSDSDWLARSAAEDGCVAQQKLRPVHRNTKECSGMYSSAIRGCHEEASLRFRAFQSPMVAPLFGDFSEIQATVTERALDSRPGGRL